MPRVQISHLNLLSHTAETPLSQGYCRLGGCSDSPAVEVGGSCFEDSQCKGKNDYSTTTCSTIDHLCGGEGTPSYSDAGTSDGVSSVCASRELAWETTS